MVGCIEAPFCDNQDPIALSSIPALPELFMVLLVEVTLR